MDTNKRVLQMQAFIGKEFTSSPSPFMHWLKPWVVAAEAGTLTFEYQVRKDMTNPNGQLHGGVTAALIDDIIGATIFSLDLTQAYTTINNVIDYFSPATEGDKIQAKTQIIKQGNKIIHVQCEVWHMGKDKLLAKGISNLLSVN
jgi:uncharacterized protein (TIGR00369 family)